LIRKLVMKQKNDDKQEKNQWIYLRGEKW